VDCPYCHHSIEPTPKRSRLCPHCREKVVVRQGHLFTESQADAFDEEKERIATAKRKARAAEWFRERRAQAKADIRDSRESGVVSGFRLLVSANDCDVCQARYDQVFPIRTCTAEQLPPYRDCEYEDGCRASYLHVLDDEGRRPAKTPPRKRTFLGFVFFLFKTAFVLFLLLIVLMIWIASRR
jgi:hypothetical protein